LVENILNGNQYVSKKIPIGILGEGEKKSALQEANLLKSLKHAHIVEHIESYIENNNLVIIMEYCTGVLTRRRLIQPH